MKTYIDLYVIGNGANISFREYFFPKKILKLGKFVRWKNRCWREDSTGEILYNKVATISISCKSPESKIDLRKLKLSKRVHFNEEQEVIIIPPRTFSERVWKPMKCRVQHCAYIAVYYLCFPCVLTIKFCFKEEQAQLNPQSSTSN